MSRSIGRGKQQRLRHRRTRGERRGMHVMGSGRGAEASDAAVLARREGVVSAATCT